MSPLTVYSFDVGFRNFGGVAVTVDRDADGQVRVKEMMHYFCEDILEAAGCAARVSRTVQSDRLIRFCADSLVRNLGHVVDTPDVVVVEAQRGKKESILSGAILGYYAHAVPGVKLRLMNALGKFKCTPAGAPKTTGTKAQRHTQLKDAAVEIAETLFPGMTCELGARAEHCADALCQAVSAGNEAIPKARKRRAVTTPRKVVKRRK
jgi:hypothetical protein